MLKEKKKRDKFVERNFLNPFFWRWLRKCLFMRLHKPRFRYERTRLRLFHWERFKINSKRRNFSYFMMLKKLFQTCREKISFWTSWAAAWKIEMGKEKKLLLIFRNKNSNLNFSSRQNFSLAKLSMKTSMLLKSHINLLSNYNLLKVEGNIRWRYWHAVCA